MELSATVFVQVVIIFILMMVGFVLAKIKMLNQSVTKQLTDILLIVVTPCVLMKAYQRDYSPELISGLIAAAVFSFLIHFAAIIISTLIFRKEESLKYRVSIFASIYSNCGFMAIPLLSAVIGEDGVFYGSAYLAIFNILYWTHGVCVYSGGIRNVSLKKIIVSPGIIGTLMAVMLFVLKIRLPYVLKESVSYLAGINTPVAMLVIGANLTRVDFKKALKNTSMYIVNIVKLIIVPVIAIGIAKLLSLDSVVAQSVIITAACPTAAVSALLAGKYDLDAVYATELVSVTTVLSVITIPLVLMLY